MSSIDVELWVLLYLGDPYMESQLGKVVPFALAVL
jgi:hypothetical protein